MKGPHVITGLVLMVAALVAQQIASQPHPRRIASNEMRFVQVSAEEPSGDAVSIPCSNTSLILNVSGTGFLTANVVQATTNEFCTPLTGFTNVTDNSWGFTSLG